MTKPIAGFFKEYRFLSNFWPSVIDYYGIRYPTVEHAYQAAKCVQHSERVAISKLKTSGQAKRAGRKTNIRSDWEEIKLGTMEILVYEKFDNHEDLKRLLLQTGDAELVEENTWGDTFWGRCNGVGKNHLGKILMKVREELKNETS